MWITSIKLLQKLKKARKQPPVQATGWAWVLHHNAFLCYLKSIKARLAMYNSWGMGEGYLNTDHQIVRASHARWFPNNLSFWLVHLHHLLYQLGSPLNMQMNMRRGISDKHVSLYMIFGKPQYHRDKDK